MRSTAAFCLAALAPAPCRALPEPCFRFSERFQQAYFGAHRPPVYADDLLQGLFEEMLGVCVDL